ncbi:hypothetical protein M0Q97_09310 [Candidatus Dojkabacteria bacterium]|jgi:hypothetical protein|nr:hypothetical protein [Candidatus Dojkabacteria bacterium]
MKIKKINENTEFLDSIEYKFNFLNDFGKNPVVQEYIDFLKSLNLTKEQYSKIAEIMDFYGSDKYDDGYDNGYDNGRDSVNDSY